MVTAGMVPGERAPRSGYFVIVNTVLRLVQGASFLIAGGAVVYLLFMLGHSELAPHGRVVMVAALAGGCALLAGLLHVAGLPASAKAKQASTRRRRRRP